jgi:lipoate---protein ligase
MLLCDLTFPSPEENLACDEVLLDLREAGETEDILRFWEPSQYFVVVGYANHVATEAALPYCRHHDIPVLRRCSGGGTVLQGPGCLNYSLLLGHHDTGPLASISGANEYIMRQHAEALAAKLGGPVTRQGHTDLAINGLKFSGNAQRRRKRSLLFHGSFLLSLDFARIEGALRMPSQQPDYRRNRSHSDFLLNLGVPAQTLKAALVDTWKATSRMESLPHQLVAELAQSKYRQESWNLRF